MSSSAAKVEVIYGQHIQRRILKTMKCSLLPLWGPYSGVFLVLRYESNSSNADQNFLIQRILLFATCPQRFSCEPSGNTANVRQDLTFQVAARFTRINFDSTYCQTKKRLSQIPSVSELGQHFLKDVYTAEHASLQDLNGRVEANSKSDLGLESQDSESKEKSEFGRWSSYFNQKPYCDDVSRKLLPAAINAVDSAIALGSEW